MHIRRLQAADAPAFHALRLSALLDTPEAFEASHDEEKDLPLAAVERRIESAAGGGVFGAFDGEALVGIAGLGRGAREKVAHKSVVWGMYVAPSGRGHGVARQLLVAALDVARAMPGVAKVMLAVDAANVPAIALYESLGFVVFARESDAKRIGADRRDELQMALRLE